MHLGTLLQAEEQYLYSRRSIRKLIASGELVGYRLGKRAIRIDLDELHALLRPIPVDQPNATPESDSKSAA